MRIGLDHNLCIFLNNLHVVNFSNTSFVEEVRSVSSSGKFYWQPPGKENNEYQNDRYCEILGLVFMEIILTRLVN